MLNIHELAAGKLVALFSRRASRDLFDTRELLWREDLDQTRLRTALVTYGAMSRKDWRAISVDEITYEPKELKNELIPLLRTQAASKLGDPKPWASKLVSECAEQLKPLISFTSAEREFLDRLLDHAEIRPSLITSDKVLASASPNTRFSPGKPKTSVDTKCGVRPSMIHSAPSLPSPVFLTFGEPYLFGIGTQ